MATDIMITDITLDYRPIAEARAMKGLRLVLGAYAVPGPWREACKGLFYVKKIPYTPVVTASAGRSDLEFGMAEADRELLEWTGQASAPVAAWNNERPVAGWMEQINLAERLNPEPPLVPEKLADRALMFGLVNELAGEHGFAWTKRLAIIHRVMPTLPPGDPARAFWTHLGEKYRYTPDGGRRAAARMAEIVSALDQQLASAKARGERYFIGGRLSALDIYWATFATMLAPPAPEFCPMATSFREHYSNPDPEVQAALSPALLAHRDYIYSTYLEYPIVF